MKTQEQQFTATSLVKEKRDYVSWMLIAFSLAYAWTQRFVQDDAFISFRYARNLAEGHGLVWNIGERIEGYTNFLWTLCMAPAFLMKLDIVAWSYTLSLVSFAVTLLVSSRLAAMWWKSRAAGWLTIALLACNHSFISYATGGLETQFGIMWVMLSIWLLQTNRLIFAALASACAVMTRMDAVLLLVPFWCGAAWMTFRGSFTWNAQRVRFALAVLAGAVPVVAWLLWRHHYYGMWVPNTFLIKSGGPNILRGIVYVTLFYVLSGIWLAVPLVVLRRQDVMRATTAFVCGITAWGAWQLYVMKVGGCHMEFRLMMPTLPLVMVTLAGLIATASRWPRIRTATAAGIMVLGTFFILYKNTCPSSFRELKKLHAEWSYLAGEMNRFMGESRHDVKIGITCAGIIPFYTGMPSLDLLGLNDREVALTGDHVKGSPRFGNRPGHVRMARWETLLDKEINLLVNHPWVAETDEEVLDWSAEKIRDNWVYYNTADASLSPQWAPRFSKDHEAPAIIVWPLENGQFWLMAYVKPHPAVDAAIERAGARIILPVSVKTNAFEEL